MLFVVKAVVSGLLVALVSWLATKRPVLAGFVTALPLVTILAIIWTYVERPDMAVVNRYAIATVAALPLTVTFFIPFLANRWLKLTFLPTVLLGVGLLLVAYTIHTLLFRES